MWYFYDISNYTNSKLKLFSERLEESFQSMFNGNTKDEYINTDLENDFERCIFKEKFDDVYDTYTSLTAPQKQFLKDAFNKNIDIENILNGNHLPVTYEAIKNYCSENMEKKLKAFCDYLYSSLKENDPFASNYISPLNYYKKLREVEVLKDSCPFCGEGTFEFIESGFREDYDHYLPKKYYPFISLHYKNLVPMCKKCNSNNKKEKDFTENGKAFYPYSTQNLGENTLKIMDLSNGEVEIEIKNSLNNKDSELDNWNIVFNIQKRVKDLVDNKHERWLQKARRREDFESEIEFLLEDAEAAPHDCEAIHKKAFFGYVEENIDDFLDDDSD